MDKSEETGVTLQDHRTAVSSLCRKSAPKTSNTSRGKGRAEIMAGHTFCLLQQRGLQTQEGALPRAEACSGLEVEAV